MTAARARCTAGSPRSRAAFGEHAWFLRGDCRWQDAVWHLEPTSALEEARPVRLHWDFMVADGRRFTDNRYAPLLESSRQLIALIRTRSLTTALSQRGSTVRCYFTYLRELVRWMDRARVSRFAHLDASALLQFQRSISERPGKRAGTLAPTTVQKYLYLLTYLYRFRGELDDALQIDPFPGQSLGAAAKVREGDIPRLPYTPQSVAVPLIQGAIEVVGHASQVLRARDVYAAAIARAQQLGLSRYAFTEQATRALQESQRSLPSTDMPAIPTPSKLAQRIDMLYAACFVVIAYLVGPRASEILHLQAGCVHDCGSDQAGDIDAVTAIVGTIFKGEAQYHGRRHEWVAPPAAVQAIAVLESLSAPHRARSARKELWLRRFEFGVTEWRHDFSGPLALPTSGRICHLLSRFSDWLGLPQHEGKPWRLTTHQGRKTFARFVALRDRSALFALAQHLGHRERAITDMSYAGSDYRLNCEIDAAILEQSVAAWEHMLAAPGLGGRAGAEIMAKRPRFRGARLKQEIRSYARMLADAGLVLGVCDWGFCVYREEHSACLGNALGPNPARREPSTCGRCKNFAVSDQHRPYWVDQVRRHEALLNEPALPLQTLRIVRERLNEARTLIRSIDAAGKEDTHGPRINR
jgi:integrase